MAAPPFDVLKSPSLLAEKVKWLEKKNADLEMTVKEKDDVIERLSAQCSALEKLQRSQKDDTTTNNIQNFIEFPYSELEEATHDFSPSFRLGEGTFGVVYKGKLRYTSVAVKKLMLENTEKVSEFEREVTVLSRVRHPNLVTLIGACLEPHCLVYEYLPNGSLEDRLLCTNGTQPLTWDVRCRIAAEICCGLLFLHSANPHTIVHGDLKPANILLDGNLTAKIGDFGICRLLRQRGPSDLHTVGTRTDPRGTAEYLDPDFVSTGFLTYKADVYAFGVIMLQLLTGKSGIGLVKEVQTAIMTRKLNVIIDREAGYWPTNEAMQFANLGLQCCEVDRKCRPDLGTVVWRMLQRYL